MKVVILAGGYGSRISEETYSRPKPMIEIGGKPLLWHIMKIFSHYGFNEFIICLGYKGYQIKEYFSNYFLHSSDVTIDISKNKLDFHQNNIESWVVTLVDTGENVQTGGRLKRVRKYLEEKDFFLTYGDGLADIDLSSLITFHQETNSSATVTATQMPGRFGALKLTGTTVEEFREKPTDTENWINGGFFILSPKVIDLIEGDSTSWEQEPLEKLAKSGALQAYKHNGFWHPLDTLRDKNYLEELWETGVPPWKIWQ